MQHERIKNTVIKQSGHAYVVVLYIFPRVIYERRKVSFFAKTLLSSFCSLFEQSICLYTCLKKSFSLKTAMHASLQERKRRNRKHCLSKKKFFFNCCLALHLKVPALEKVVYIFPIMQWFTNSIDLFENHSPRIWEKIGYICINTHILIKIITADYF